MRSLVPAADLEKVGNEIGRRAEAGAITPGPRIVLDQAAFAKSAAVNLISELHT